MSTDSFIPALRKLRVDDRGRVNIGAVLPDAKGRTYAAEVSPLDGRVLLTPSDAAEAQRQDTERVAEIA